MKLVVTQNAIYFFEPDALFEENKNSILLPELSKFSFQEKDKIKSENIQAKIVDKFLFNISKKIPDIPETEIAIVQIVDIQKKEQQLVCCRTDQDSETLCRAITCGNIWTNYKKYCDETLQIPNMQFLNWLIKVSQFQNQFVPLVLEQFDIFELQGNADAYKINEKMSTLVFLKQNSLIQSLIIQDTQMNDDIIKQTEQILKLIQSNLILQLDVVRCKINEYMMTVLTSGLQHQMKLQKINLSYNLINDQALLIFSDIFQSLSFVTELNLSYNKIQGDPTKLELFLDNIQMNLQDFHLDIKGNLLRDQSIEVIENCVMFAENSEIVSIELGENNFSFQGYARLNHSYQNCPNWTKLKLNIKPIPFHSIYIKQMIQNRATLHLNITRQSKPSLLQDFKSIQKQIKNIEINIIELVYFKQINCTVEEIYNICLKINKLEFGYPLQKLEKLQNLIWEKINIVLENNDAYSVQILKDACKCISLNISSIQHKIDSLFEKTKNITKNIEKVLNFLNEKEENINIEFEQFYEQALKFDLRGEMIHVMQAIKEKRDDFILKWINEGQSEDFLKDLDISQIPFQFLEQNSKIESINKLKFQSNQDKLKQELEQLNKNLSDHPKIVDYFALANLSNDEIMDNLDLSQKILQDPTQLAQNFYQLNYLLKNVYQRSLFLLADHVIKFYSNVWLPQHQDIQLICSRIIMQYLQINERPEIQSMIQEQIDLKVQKFIQFELNLPQNQVTFMIDFDITKYPGLKTNDEYFAKEDMIHKKTIKDKEQLLITQMFQNKRDLLTYVPGEINQSLSKSVIPDFDNKAITLFRKFQEISNVYMIVKDTEINDDLLLKYIQEYVSIILDSELNNKSPKISNISTPKTVMSTPRSPSKSAKTSQQNSTVNQQQQKEPKQRFFNQQSEKLQEIDLQKQSLHDEAYLQLFRYINVNPTQKSLSIRHSNVKKDVVEHIQIVMRIMCILTLYCPPSRGLRQYVKSWLIAMKAKKEASKWAERCLLNLQNHNLVHFKRPWWKPSTYELVALMKERKVTKISVDVHSRQGNFETFDLDQFTTIGQFMDILYEKCSFVSRCPDKYSFWLYQGGIDEEIAFNREQIVEEILAKWDFNYQNENDSPNFLVKRRISSSFFTLNLQSLEHKYQSVLEQIFHEIFFQYLNNNRFNDYLDINTVCKITALLFSLYSKYNRRVNSFFQIKIDLKKLSELMPEMWLNRLSLDQFIKRIEKYVYDEMYDSMQENELKIAFLEIFKNFYLFQGNIFDARIFENGTYIQVKVIINVFGIFLFDYQFVCLPIKTIYYEELLFIIGQDKEINLGYINTSLFKNISSENMDDPDYQITLDLYTKLERGREFYEDVVNYCVMRTKESQRLLYLLQHMPQFKNRFKKNLEQMNEDEIDEIKEMNKILDEEIKFNKLVSIDHGIFTFHSDFKLLKQQDIQYNQLQQEIDDENSKYQDSQKRKVSASQQELQKDVNKKKEIRLELKELTKNAVTAAIQNEKKSNPDLTSISPPPKIQSLNQDNQQKLNIIKPSISPPPKMISIQQSPDNQKIQPPSRVESKQQIDATPYDNDINRNKSDSQKKLDQFKKSIGPPSRSVSPQDLKQIIKLSSKDNSISSEKQVILPPSEKNSRSGSPDTEKKKIAIGKYLIKPPPRKKSENDNIQNKSNEEQMQEIKTITTKQQVNIQEVQQEIKQEKPKPIIVQMVQHDENATQGQKLSNNLNSALASFPLIKLKNGQTFVQPVLKAKPIEKAQIIEEDLSKEINKKQEESTVKTVNIKEDQKSEINKDQTKIQAPKSQISPPKKDSKNPDIKQVKPLPQIEINDDIKNSKVSTPVSKTSTPRKLGQQGIKPPEFLKNASKILKDEKKDEIPIIKEEPRQIPIKIIVKETSESPDRKPPPNFSQAQKLKIKPKKR